MLVELLLASVFQIGPFFEKGADDSFAARPFVAREKKTLDVLWPCFTYHGDWWRFLLFMHYQENPKDGSWQFDISPVWTNGKTRDGRSYASLFPVYGRHPHILLVDDLQFALWPLWTRYSRFRRGAEQDKLVTNTVLFPFFSFRSDGAWSVWPFYGVNYQRRSVHRYLCWPFFTWARYEKDRDSSGSGMSWMFWPLAGAVSREREEQRMFLPPFFSYATVQSKAPARGDGSYFRLRAPWPFFETGRTRDSEYISLWPFYSRRESFDYSTGRLRSAVTRYGWKLVENYEGEELRVFPFYVNRRDGSYFRFWPFYESKKRRGAVCSRFLSFIPIRHVPQIDRSWADFWTFYESEESPVYTDHRFFWGLISWRAYK